MSEEKVKYNPKPKVEKTTPTESTINPQLVQPVEVYKNQMFQLMDRLDEEAILEELSGRITDQVCYEFECTDKTTATGKRLVAGVSWKGAMEMANSVKNIGADPSVKPVGDIRNGNMFVMVYCKDSLNNVGIWGSSFAPAMRKIWSKEKNVYIEVEDNFAFIKAMNKAQRNGILALIQNTLKEEFIQGWRNKGRIHRLEAPKSNIVDNNQTVATPQISTGNSAKVVPETKKDGLF